MQGPPCRIDVDFKDEKGRRYHKTAVVKGKNGETEEQPLYTNHDNIFGEVRLMLDPTVSPAPSIRHCWHGCDRHKVRVGSDSRSVLLLHRCASHP